MYFTTLGAQNKTAVLDARSIVSDAGSIENGFGKNYIFRKSMVLGLDTNSHSYGRIDYNNKIWLLPDSTRIILFKIIPAIPRLSCVYRTIFFHCGWRREGAGRKGPRGHLR
jgi:hypothetical protein